MIEENQNKGKGYEMSDTYVECLVKAKPSWIGKFFKMLLIMLTVVFVLAIFVLQIGRAHV